MTMKHAFLIMAHGRLPLLRVLLSMLDDERNDIFLHIDRKSDMPVSYTHLDVYKRQCYDRKFTI